jgi:hypothetical protein
VKDIVPTIRTVLLLALLTAFVAFVWPTRFRYDHMTFDGDLVPVRIDRFSGNAEMLVPDSGWLPVETPPDDASATPTRRAS